jgi:hypothetical protein
MKLLYCEDEHKPVVTKSINQIERFIINIDIKQRLNSHRKIEVYKINFETKDLTDDCIINLFKIITMERKKELFTELY